MPWMEPARSSSETACCFGELAWILSMGWCAGSGPQDWEWGRGNREGGKSPLGSIRWGPWNAPQDCPLQAQTRALVLWLNPWSRGHLSDSLSLHPPPLAPSLGLGLCPVQLRRMGQEERGAPCRRQVLSRHPFHQVGSQACYPSGGLTHGRILSCNTQLPPATGRPKAVAKPFPGRTSNAASHLDGAAQFPEQFNVHSVIPSARHSIS